MSEISLLVRTIDDKFAIRKGDSQAPASSLIARVLRDIEGANANPNEYKVLVAYQLLQPDLDLEKLFSQEENDRQGDAKAISLDALDIKTGHYLIFIKSSTVATKLLLDVGGDVFEVKEQGYSVGREDTADGVFPSLDLTSYLGEYERKVSRSLVKFKEDNGKWKVILEAKARTTVFVDGIRLKHGDELDVGDNTINIGNSPEDPYLRIKTKVVSG